MKAVVLVTHIRNRDAFACAVTVTVKTFARRRGTGARDEKARISYLGAPSRRSRPIGACRKIRRSQGCMYVHSAKVLKKERRGCEVTPPALYVARVTRTEPDRSPGSVLEPKAAVCTGAVICVLFTACKFSRERSLRMSDRHQSRYLRESTLSVQADYSTFTLQLAFSWECW